MLMLEPCIALAVRQDTKLQDLFVVTPARVFFLTGKMAVLLVERLSMDVKLVPTAPNKFLAQVVIVQRNFSCLEEYAAIPTTTNSQTEQTQVVWRAIQ